MQDLGRRLRYFRLANGWSKRGLADKLGVSIPSIIRWEKGIAEPNDYNRYKIEQLIAQADEPTPPNTGKQISQLHLFPDGF